LSSNQETETPGARDSITGAGSSTASEHHESTSTALGVLSFEERVAAVFASLHPSKIWK